jgi:hypothetical protein
VRPSLRGTRRGSAGPIVDRKAEGVAELMLEVGSVLLPDPGFRPEGRVHHHLGGSGFGFMRSLALLGPLTVPQIPRMRPTSRQRMQRLADELAGGDWSDSSTTPDIGARSRWS